MTVRVFVAAFMALALAGCEPAGLSSSWQRIDPPQPAPDFALQTLAGDTVRLSSFKGRIVLVEFWATWCGPCRFSTPSLDAMYRKYSEKGVSALLVNQAEEPEVVRQWAGKRFMAPILLDRQNAVGTMYQATSLPTLVVVDHEGRMVYRKEGYGGGLEAQLKIVLDELLTPQGSDPAQAEKGVRPHG